MIQKRGLLTAVVALAGSALLGGAAQASINYSVAGSTHSEEFNGNLPIAPENASLQATAAWVNDPTPPGANQSGILGWILHHPITQAEGGADGHSRLRAGPGSANTGSFWSFGASGSGERALGSIGSNTMSAVGSPMHFGVRFRNDTGVTLNEFTFSYRGEQWRDAGNAVPVPESLTFDYSLDAPDIQNTGSTGTFVPVPLLDFTSPTFTTTAQALNGNDPLNQSPRAATVTGINWLPNTDLWLRWSDLNNPNNDAGLAIDACQFMAIEIPEPASVGVLAAAALLSGLRRRAR